MSKDREISFLWFYTAKDREELMSKDREKSFLWFYNTKGLGELNYKGVKREPIFMVSIYT